MDIPYVETDCTFHASNGQSYTAGGAVVTPDACMGYLKSHDGYIREGVLYPERRYAVGVLTDWRGRELGTYRIVAVWRTPHSTVSSVMCQVEATVGGVVYTGRSAGYGMLFKGKRKAKQPRRGE